MKIIAFIPGLVWIILIFILLTMPGSDIPSNDFFDLIYFDKWVHIGLFGILTMFWSYPLLKLGWIPVKIFLLIASLATFYGIIMEFVQKYFTTSRSFDIVDILADTSGAFIAALFLINFRKSRS
ncbi:MAG: VanZ family protein [Panacibacter sp.]